MPVLRTLKYVPVFYRWVNYLAAKTNSLLLSSNPVPIIESPHNCAIVLDKKQREHQSPNCNMCVQTGDALSIFQLFKQLLQDSSLQSKLITESATGISRGAKKVKLLNWIFLYDWQKQSINFIIPYYWAIRKADLLCGFHQSSKSWFLSIQHLLHFSPKTQLTFVHKMVSYETTKTKHDLYTINSVDFLFLTCLTNFKTINTFTLIESSWAIIHSIAGHCVFCWKK